MWCWKLVANKQMIHFVWWETPSLCNKSSEPVVLWYQPLWCSRVRVFPECLFIADISVLYMVQWVRIVSSAHWNAVETGNVHVVVFFFSVLPVWMQNHPFTQWCALRCGWQLTQTAQMNCANMATVQGCCIQKYMPDLPSTLQPDIYAPKCT